jgi:hypothetical protein
MGSSLAEEIGQSPDAIAVRLAAVELFTDRFPQVLRHAERGLAVPQALGSGRHLPCSSRKTVLPFTAPAPRY